MGERPAKFTDAVFTSNILDGLNRRVMMSDYEPGTRVIAMSHSNAKQVFVYGEGIFEGHFEYGNESKEAEELSWPRGNPRIRLDSGACVWGCECWWGPAEQVRARVYPGKEVLLVDISEERGRDPQRGPARG